MANPNCWTWNLLEFIIFWGNLNRLFNFIAAAFVLLVDKAALESFLRDFDQFATWTSHFLWIIFPNRSKHLVGFHCFWVRLCSSSQFFEVQCLHEDYEDQAVCLKFEFPEKLFSPVKNWLQNLDFNAGKKPALDDVQAISKRDTQRFSAGMHDEYGG